MIRRICCLAVLAAPSLLLPSVLSSQAMHPKNVTIVAPVAGGGCSELAAGQEAGGASGKDSGNGFNLANLDRAVKPCDDFFHFADGGWIKDNPIPADHSNWATFNKLQDKNEDALRAILDEASKDTSAKPGSNWQKIGDFYASCMNEEQIETAGLKPLDPELQRIADIKDKAGLQAEIARLQREGANAVFDFGSEQDFKDSKQVIAAAEQGGLGLPDRQYYRDKDEHSAKLRDQYAEHVTNMFKLMGDDADKAATEAKTALSIETTLANASLDRADRRNPDNIYHKMAMTQLGELTPHLSWDVYFKEVNAPAVSAMNIEELDFFKAVDAAFTSVPLDDWKTYLRWHLIHSTASGLSSKFVDENFNFYGKMLTGQKEMLPRWRRCVESTNRELGEALGQYYVERNFPPEAKAKAIVMVKNLIAALHDDLQTLDWMSPATRQQAIKKLQAINLKIGYPDKWRDYSGYKVGRVSYVGNLLRGRTFDFDFDLSKIGKPVDRTEWHMTPPTVNAYYNPLMNEIVFPAGILEPPFFDPNGDPAINYGGIGAVMGHEMTHGFDDQGARFDAEGNLKNWWTDQDLKNFKERGDCIVKQFEAYTYEDLHENGKLVEGESIADLGGLTIAHAAFEKTLEGKPTPPPVDGFTEEQRFFLGFAQVWAGSYRPEAARLQVRTNEHPLGEYRTNGPLSNMPSFAKAFGCSAGSRMVRSDALRCRIW
ncbi:MAG TPA: M13 family metallopeptidase [Candidatus Acidoferrales bacterium]|nr:M13 family metallopeptidase [Candidatus Acidoferrales bacterium]